MRFVNSVVDYSTSSSRERRVLTVETFMKPGTRKLQTQQRGSIRHTDTKENPETAFCVINEKVVRFFSFSILAPGDDTN